jgi:cytochrome c-type biogenesis protein CcmH
MTDRARAIGWAAMAAVLAALLTVGALGDRGPRTTAERVDGIARTVACPVCNGESIDESRAEIAAAMRDETARLVEQGGSDAEIRAYWASRYGQEVLLTPPGTGIGALVWILPVVGLVAAVAGLVIAFRRWRVRPDVAVSDADRALVEEALQRARRR